jgi:hypothetical protein
MPIFAADNFNAGTTGNALSSSASDGGTWTHHTSYASSAVSYITQGAVKGVRGNVLIGGFDVSTVYHSGTPIGADYTVSGNLYEVGSASAFREAAVAGRINTAADTLVSFGYQQGTGWIIRQQNAGSASTLGSTPATLTDGTAYLLELVFAGNQVTGKVNGSTVLGPHTTAVTSAGKAGIRFIGAGATNNYHYLDDFAATDAESGTAKPVLFSTFYRRMRSAT